ncbi:hypothetical protein DFA_07009 [Cavenderia fasciculata]|uniref:THH1/TOM1/TOM3 domain-containing protein n=1 Tax=Cavenderia fasciculata TaxID=261658 RepID=F4PXA1_CACFS|nr:uncharacterized protein DFA_07009 [Cavenderia fasciculata]EGG19904.1 hypothetical protein DFA_07009 [Cavenderia fasciculata]|eukprot:XP_004366887.1 hypothetical protein DFA_07009 [Cavenderia fasciculata]
MKRGAIFFFAEGMAYIVIFFVFGIQLLKEISYIRIPYGILCYVYDIDEPYENPTVFMLYIVAIHFYTISWYFILLCWVKLVVTFFSKDKKVDFRRSRVVEYIITVVIILTSIFHVVIIALYYKYPNNDYDVCWRWFFGMIAAIIFISFTFYGSNLIRQLSGSNKDIDVVILRKMYFLLGLLAFMGPVLAVLNPTYYYYARSKAPQDWYNLVFYGIEIINSFAVLTLLGRNPLLFKIREMVGISEIYHGLQKSTIKLGSMTRTNSDQSGGHSLDKMSSSQGNSYSMTPSISSPVADSTLQTNNSTIETKNIIIVDGADIDSSPDNNNDEQP